jgi:carboxyl-terminal processing protease
MFNGLSQLIHLTNIGKDYNLLMEDFVFGVKQMASLRAVWQRFRPFQASFLLVAVFIGGFVLGNQRIVSLAQSDTVAPAGSAEEFEPFWQVYNLIQSNYLEDVDSSVLVDGAINGMVESLDDQFSGYMDPSVYDLINQDLSGEINGIGVVIETVEDTEEIRVVQILKGTPADIAGLMPGDIFAKVDGEDVAGMSQLELAGKVRGPEGSTVVITIKRGEDLTDFTIIRAKITIPTVESRLLDHNIGYIKLNDFNVHAREQVDLALEELDVNNLDGLVFDLRGNPGGLLSSAIDITSAFIKDGTILVEDFGDGSEQVYSANGSYIGLSIPMVVLVDGNSASASELVAGALQDRDRATIMGETTFGKGTVQTWQSLVNGGGVRLTIARWLTPDRHWIHELGITPDVLVEWPEEDRDSEIDPQLQAAIEHLTLEEGQPVAQP